MIIAFLLAAFFSFLLSLLKIEKEKEYSVNKFLFAIGIGVAFGICNLLNTILAGRLDSSVFFPTLNIGTIFFSLISGMVLYKEKIRKNDIAVISIGITAILLITVA